jgi:hypothetical protein
LVVSYTRCSVVTDLGAVPRHGSLESLSGWGQGRNGDTVSLMTGFWSPAVGFLFYSSLS